MGRQSRVGEVLPSRVRLEPVTSIAGDEVAQILDAVRGVGCDTKRLCREAHIDATQLSEPFHRVPAQTVDRLFERAQQQTGDLQLGLHAAERAGSRSMSTYLFRTQATAREALERIVRYQEVLYGAHTVELSALEGYAVWMFAVGRHPAAHRHTSEYLIARRCATLYAEAMPPVVPVEVHFKHHWEGEISEYERIFRCPVHFEARQHAVVFARPAMSRRLRGTNPIVAAELERVLQRQLEVLHEVDLCSRVRLIVRVRLLDEATCDRDAVARRLGVSSRTLQRRLEHEGVTFRELLDDVRRDLAQELLADPQRGIRDVSESCGFTEVSAFYRAFRRWSGVGPSTFRAQLERQRATPLDPADHGEETVGRAQQKR